MAKENIIFDEYKVNGVEVNLFMIRQIVGYFYSTDYKKRYQDKYGNDKDDLFFGK